MKIVITVNVNLVKLESQLYINKRKDNTRRTGIKNEIMRIGRDVTKGTYKPDKQLRLH